MRKYWFVFLFVLVLGAVNTGSILAEVFFDTGAQNPSTGWTISGPTSLPAPPSQAVADQVTVAADWQLDKVTVAGWYVLGDVRFVTVSLLTDDNGLPGELIDSWDIELSPNAGEYRSADTPSAPILSANTPYWFTMLPGADNQWAAWNLSTQTRGTIAFSNDSGDTWRTVQDSLGTLRLEGTRQSADREGGIPPTPTVNDSGERPSITVNE